MQTWGDCANSTCTVALLGADFLPPQQHYHETIKAEQMTLNKMMLFKDLLND